MKGVLLAGGRATRLLPLTRTVCKQLLPVYDKPMVYYSLSVLLIAGIRDILIISTPQALPQFKELFGDGSQLGVSISYCLQQEPRGIAESFILAERFIGKERVCLILGDNIFYGHNLSALLQEAARQKEGATIFGYYVKDPSRYGVVEFSSRGKPKAIVEKPKDPKSNYAVTGLYFYDNQVIRIAGALKPSARGELEITDLNNAYLKRKKLNIKLLGRGHAWLDMGTYDSLIDASIFIKTMEDRQGLKIGCIEEIAYRMGYIDAKALKGLARSLPSNYAEYLLRISRELP